MQTLTRYLIQTIKPTIIENRFYQPSTLTTYFQVVLTPLLSISKPKIIKISKACDEIVKHIFSVNYYIDITESTTNQINYNLLDILEETVAVFKKHIYCQINNVKYYLEENHQEDFYQSSFPNA